MAKVKRPPGPKSRKPGGALLDYARDPTGFLLRTAEQYGDMAYFKLGPQHTYLLNHPDYVEQVLITHADKFRKGRSLERAKRLVGEGLVTSEGRLHREHRRLMQPAFHRERLMEYGAIMTQQAARRSEQWRDGETVNLHAELTQLTLGIVCRAVFSAEVAGEEAELTAAFTELARNPLMLPFSEHLEGLPLPARKRLQQARSRLDATVNRIIAERRARGGEGRDLLAVLLEAERDGVLSPEHVRDQCITLFFAGHETVSNGLSWAWYALAQHPEVERQLRAEVDMVLDGRLAGFGDIPQLRYTEMVWAEILRMYPPAWNTPRRAIQACTIGGYMIEPDAVVLLSQWTMHHDARWYPDPFRLDPQRWTPEAKSSRPRFSYFPFGAGARQCIGDGFAWTEGILLLATLAQRWRMRLAPGHRVLMQPRINLRPRDGMWMVLEKRAALPRRESDQRSAGRAGCPSAFSAQLS